MPISVERNLRFLQPLDLPQPGDDARDMRRRIRGCHRDEFGLVLPIGDARDRAHLRVAQFTASKRRANQRQLRQRVRDAHFLARRHQIEPAMRVQPMRAARHRFVTPRFRRVQLFDQHQKAVFSAMNVGAQRNDFGLNRLDTHGGIRTTGFVYSISKPPSIHNPNSQTKGNISRRSKPPPTNKPPRSPPAPHHPCQPSNSHLAERPLRDPRCFAAPSNAAASNSNCASKSTRSGFTSRAMNNPSVPAIASVASDRTPSSSSSPSKNPA